MESNYDERNKAQIIRVDARNCFVESKNDSFEIGKAHLEFATYDTSKPSGQRQSNHVHIYIDIAEFLCLTQEALTGMLHGRARQQKAAGNGAPLYQSLGGTSAEKLGQYGRARMDGKSLSRTVKLLYSDRKDDFYLFVADSGPGDTDAKGLIVPRFGNTPENHVAVNMSWRSVNELLMMTKTHYEAWLSAKYASEMKQADPRPAGTQPQSRQPAQTPPQPPRPPQAPAPPKQTPPTQADMSKTAMGGSLGIADDTPISMF